LDGLFFSERLSINDVEEKVTTVGGVGFVVLLKLVGWLVKKTVFCAKTLQGSIVKNASRDRRGAFWRLVVDL